MNSSKPLRVMHIVETLDNGGAERVLANIVNNLPKDFVSFVCCLKNSGVVAGSLSNLGGPVHELRRYTGNSYSCAFLLAKILRQHRIDIIHAHNWNTFSEAILGGLMARTPRIINTIHGMQTPYPAESAAFLKKVVRTLAEKVLVWMSSGICAVSQKVREHVIDQTGISPKKVSVVYNGIETTEGTGIQKTSRDKSAPSSDYVLCWAGRLAPVKNLSCLLEALALVRHTVTNVRLDLIGDGPDKDVLKRKATDLGIEDRVRFLGYTSNVREYLSLADVFVLPSHYEGFSVALLEAMSMGLPVIASDVGGNPEIVIHNQTGLLVPPGDVQALAQSVIELYGNNNVRIEMGVRGRERVSKEFSIERMISEYVRVYTGGQA